MNDSKISGTLYIVATPIGNLEDMTFRAVNTLQDVDLIAAEDTRHSRVLLSHFNISTPLVSCHEHNEHQKSQQLIARLKAGENIALISDAGTPCISDPGYVLVRQASKDQIPVVPIPGCSAAIAGLSVSGLPTDAFIFIGFLPKKKQQQKKAIREFSDQTATLILYESPKRVLGLIRHLNELLGNRQACLGREITKLHEEFIRGSLTDIIQALEDRPVIKGECALFLHGSTGTRPMGSEELDALLTQRILSSSMGTSQLARQVADEFNLSKKAIYDKILKLKSR